jgi:hypothetical protein
MLTLELNVNATPVELKGPDNTVSKYTIREMSVAEREQYVDLLRVNMIFNSEGKAVGVKKMEGTSSALLTRCMQDVSANRLVTKEQVEKWPSRVVEQLVEEANRLNGFKTVTDAKTGDEVVKAAGEEVKNG